MRARLGGRQRDAREALRRPPRPSSATSSAPSARSPRAHMLTADRLRPDVPDPAHQHALLGRARRCPRPASGRRFGRDPAIFQYYPGHGLQLQPLASWGRANAIAGACLAALRSAHDARTAAARAIADALAGPARRAGRAPQRLPRVGVLLRLRDRHAAVGERDDAGDRDPGARRAATARSGKKRWRRARAERARRLRAGRRRTASRCAAPGGAPLPPVLVRARRTACSTAACRP